VAERAVTLADLADEAGRLWGRLPAGSVVWLIGDLGAGKTTFAQALARAARATPARSPTYALVHLYASPEGPIAHADCYRLRHPDEARDLDLAGLHRDSRLLMIEWPERAGPHAPPPDVQVRLHHGATPALRLLEIVP
jgi:tRNA threonylcarbamoyladenosine biosynthesis protein TsaE